MATRSRKAVTTAVSDDIPVVGMREPCPCGSGKRYKVCHGKAARARETQTSFVARPFAGLPNEVDWVALRELVPAATATARTTAEYGAQEITVCTLLPGALAGLRRDNGEILVGLQTLATSGDASRDTAAAILALLDAEPGTEVGASGAPGDGPRLQDILDLSVPFTPTVLDAFDYWLEGDDHEPAIAEMLQQANESVIPTVRLTNVEGAYWCRIGQREHLRWVLPHDEEPLLDALARLQARRELHLGPGTRLAGAFRGSGVVVPVWDLEPGAEADEIADDVARLAGQLAAALAEETPLNADERRARAGIVSRQLTLR